MDGIGEVRFNLSTTRSGDRFLSAVADRFGLWGVYGHSHVAWGNFDRFVGYTAKPNWFLPSAMIPAVAIIATAAETLFGLLLALGWNTRITALLSGVLDQLCTNDDDGFGSKGGPSICRSFRLPRECCS